MELFLYLAVALLFVLGLICGGLMIAVLMEFFYLVYLTLEKLLEKLFGDWLWRIFEPFGELHDKWMDWIESD